MDWFGLNDGSSARPPTHGRNQMAARHTSAWRNRLVMERLTTKNQAHSSPAILRNNDGTVIDLEQRRFVGDLPMQNDAGSLSALTYGNDANGQRAAGWSSGEILGHEATQNQTETRSPPQLRQDGAFRCLSSDRSSRSECNQTGDIRPGGTD